MWNITTKINFSQPGGVNVILQTVRQIDATQNKAVPDDPYARLFKAAPSCLYLFMRLFSGEDSSPTSYVSVVIQFNFSLEGFLNDKIFVFC